ncbi:MAG: Ig-like domain-containing protein [Acidobacteriota bacterium]
MISRRRNVFNAGISLFLALSLLLAAIPLSARDSVIPSVACGDNHILALQDDGTVWAWGVNNCGQVGNGKADFKGGPINVLTGAKKIFAYGGSSFAIKDNGKVWGWGKNWKATTAYVPGNDTYLQGYGNDQRVPVEIEGLADIDSISVAYPTALALTNDGKVIDWSARSEVGILDGASSTNQTRLWNVTDAKAIAAGNGHALVIKKDGTVWGWGDNDQGQLGNGEVTNARVVLPRQVSNLNNIVAIAAGYKYSMALRYDGTVWAWGDNSRGQMGTGIGNSPLITPEKIKDLSNIAAISAGSYHALALDRSGMVWAWGDNSYGQLGTSNDHFKAGVKPDYCREFTDVKAISAGGWISAAVKDDDSIWNWGRNGWGQLNGGSSAEVIAPVRVKGLVVGVPVEGITLDRYVLELTKKTSPVKLNYKMIPSMASNTKVTWESGNKGIAEVDSNGVITPKAIGDCIVTAKTADGGFTAVCKVTIGVPVSSIKLNHSNLTLTLGGPSAKLVPTVSPITAMNKAVQWVSTNSKVATVDINGIVRPVGIGVTKIIIKSSDSTVSAQCNVNVVPKPAPKRK